MWDALKYEVWNMEDESIAASVLDTFTAMAARLSREKEYLRIFLSPVAKECREHLEDIPTKQSKASESVIASLSRASVGAFNYLAPPLIEYLLDQFEKADSVTKLHGVLEILVEVMRSSSSALGEWSRPSQMITDDNMSVDVQDFDWKEKVYSCFKQIASSDSSFGVPIRVLAFQGLRYLCKAKSLLEDSAIIRVLQVSCETAIDLKSDSSQDIREAAIDVLKSVAGQKPQLVLNETIPSLVAKLTLQDIGKDDCREEVLEVLAKIGTVDKVRTTVIVRLKNHLIEVIQKNAPEEYTVVVTAALLYALSANQGFSNQNCKLTYDDVLYPIISTMFTDDGDRANYTRSVSVIDGLGKICNILIRQESSEMQTRLAPEVYRLHRNIPQDDSSPFGISFDNNYESMILSTYLLASFRREVQLPFSLTRVLNALISICLEQQISVTVRATLHLQISVLVNKFLVQKEMDTVMEDILSAHKLLERHDARSTKIAFILAKALLLRGHRCAYRIITELLNRLAEGDDGLLVAQCFTTLLHPADIMTEENHFILKLGLHKQRLFNMLLSTTVQRLKTVTASFDTDTKRDTIQNKADKNENSTTTTRDMNDKEAVKRNHLLALAGITRSVNYHYVIEPELHTFFPLLLQSLDFAGDDFVRVTATDILLSAIVQSPRVVEEHVSGVLGRLLGIANANASANASAYGDGTSTTPLQTRAEAGPPPLQPGNDKADLQHQQQQNSSAIEVQDQDQAQDQAQAQTQARAPPKLRASALQCLALMPSNLRGNVLIPFRRNVIKRLVGALDDGKRMVRVEAVRCKARWVELDEPDDD